jgi:hypothetical protein
MVRAEAIEHPPSKDAGESSEGRLMNPDSRNAIVVVALTGAMTLGALTLSALAPNPSRPRQIEGLLTAQHGAEYEAVRIEFVPDLQQTDRNEFDCLIFADPDRPHWEPKSTHLRVGVAATGHERMPDDQKRTLLEALASIEGVTRTRPLRVMLDPGSDYRVNSSVPPEARDLCELLVLKAYIE